MSIFHEKFRAVRWKIVTAISLVGLLLFSLSACSSDHEVITEGYIDDQTPLIYTTAYPLYVLTDAISMGIAEVRNIGAGGDLHDLELSVSQVNNLENSDLIIYLGDGFQASVDDALAEVNTNRYSAFASFDSAELIEEDPHFWNSPKLLVELAQNLTEFLCGEYSILCQYFEGNSQDVIERLEEVGTLYDTVEQCDTSSATLLSVHGAFNYLARDYNFEAESILGIESHDEASLAELNSISDLILQQNISFLAYDPNDDEGEAESYAETLGLELKEVYNLESVKDFDTMIEYLSTNYLNISELLGCG